MSPFVKRLRPGRADEQESGSSASTAPSAMRDGVYVSSLNVDGRSAIGLLTLVGNHGKGSDGIHQFEIQVGGSGHHLTGIINVIGDPELAAARGLPHHYSLSMIGSGNQETFNLIGLGPNGIVVEIDAAWREPSTE